MTSRPGAHKFWTEDRVRRLRELAPQGLSYAAMALEIGDGATRNSVLSKIKRLRVVKPDAPKGGYKEPAAPRRQPCEAWKALPGIEPVTLLELTNDTCRWPIGETKPFMFCGAHPEAGSVYCATHQATAVPHG